MANLEKLVEELSTLTVLEAANLSKMLEEKWGVSAAAPVAVAAAGGGAGPAPEARKAMGTPGASRASSARSVMVSPPR